MNVPGRICGCSREGADVMHAALCYAKLFYHAAEYDVLAQPQAARLGSILYTAYMQITGLTEEERGEGGARRGGGKVLNLLQVLLDQDSACEVGSVYPMFRFWRMRVRFVNEVLVVVSSARSFDWIPPL